MRADEILIRLDLFRSLRGMQRANKILTIAVYLKSSILRFTKSKSAQMSPYFPLQLCLAGGDTNDV